MSESAPPSAHRSSTNSPSLAAPATFADLVKNAEVLAALNKLNITVPTPVQAATLPAVAQGGDLIVQAMTGSGKTLAFALPLLAQLDAIRGQRDTYGLIVTPTRELATQITEVIQSIASDVQPVCLIGGVSSAQQINDLKRDHRIVVGTPGRIQDHIRQKTLNLKKCQYFVLDEADEMLSMDFLVDIQNILSNIPVASQGLFVSATITPRVESLAQKFLKDPRRITVSSPEGEEMPTIEHLYVEVEGEVTAKAQALCDLIEVRKPRSAIIFCNTKSDTELVEVFLRRRGFDARRINSDLNQRQRDFVMSKIRANELRFLIGTDIAARGIDIAQIELVVNYAISDQAEVYVHRTGRTGRAGRKGEAISLVGPQDFAAFLNLKRQVAIELKKIPLPSEDEITTARLSHFNQIMQELGVAAQRRDHALATRLLQDLGVQAPPQAVVEMIAKMTRFTVEHVLKTEASTLEEEMTSARGKKS